MFLKNHFLYYVRSKKKERQKMAERKSEREGKVKNGSDKRRDIYLMAF